MDPANIRLPIFLAVLGLMLSLELFWPRRHTPPERRLRWTSNFGIQLLNTLLLRLLFPGTAIGIAAFYSEQGIGLLQGQDPRWTIPLSLLVLDLAIYLQHVASHRWSWLWRLHRMHHSDTHLDASSALRFHPAEIMLSMLWKALVLALLGAPVIAVLIFEILLNACAIFNHANVRLPPGLDRVLRRLIVTPDMHRVHHSILPEETNSNYGFNLPWWDRLFGTYRDQPRRGHECMTIGLQEFRAREDGRLDRLLFQPLRGGS